MIAEQPSVRDVQPEEMPMRPVRGYWRESGGRLLANRLGMASALLILFLALVALLAPLAPAITHYGPAQQDLVRVFDPPSGRHWLGTDDLGRDTLTRLIFGARVSLGVAFLTVGLAVLLGTAVGIVAGFYGGWLDDVLMRLVDVLLAIPAIFLFIMLAMLFRPSIVTLAVIIASISWITVARIVRAEVRTIRLSDFMLATLSIGATSWRLMSRHLLPAVIPVMIVSASLSVGQIILVEASLDFLGLGIQPPTPSWGNMVATAQTYFQHGILLAIFPGAVIFATVLATNIAGNAIRDSFDTSLR